VKAVRSKSDFVKPSGEQTMPLVCIDLRKEKDAAYRQDIGRAVYKALISVGVPQNDRFEEIERAALRRSGCATFVR
jgi:hypothetical protein